MQVVIDGFKNGYSGVNLPINLLLLQDCVIYIYDQKVEREVWDLASLSGALIFSDLVPYLTTHILTQHETPELHQMIATI